MTTIDLHDAVRGLVDIVKRFGADHKAIEPGGGGGCVYFVTDNHRLVPVCIVGQYLADLGILRATLTNISDEYPEPTGSCLTESVLWENASTMGVDFTEEAKEFLLLAQRSQDAGFPWGHAVSQSLGEVEEAKRNAVSVSFLPLRNLTEAYCQVEEPEVEEADFF